jgi:hypothetical protein
MPFVSKEANAVALEKLKEHEQKVARCKTKSNNQSILRQRTVLGVPADTIQRWKFGKDGEDLCGKQKEKNTRKEVNFSWGFQENIWSVVYPYIYI